MVVFTFLKLTTLIKMTTKQKIILSVGIGTIIVGGWYIYLYLKTFKPTSVSLNIPVEIDIDTTKMYADNKLSDIQNTIDAEWQDAVIIGDATFVKDKSDGRYFDDNGNAYDDQLDTIESITGKKTYIDPSTVTYGSLDDNGNFIND